MNIIIGKFGKSINFEPLQWGMIGGDSESAILAQSIAHLYPDDNFYLVSRNNFSKLSIDTQMKINKNNKQINMFQYFVFQYRIYNNYKNNSKIGKNL